MSGAVTSLLALACFNVGHVVERVVLAWPMGTAMKFTSPQYRLSDTMSREYFLVFATEVSAKPDINDDEGALFSVEGSRSKGGSVGHSSVAIIVGG